VDCSHESGYDEGLQRPSSMSDGSYGKLTALTRLSKRVAQDQAATAFDDALALVGDATGAFASVLLLDQGGMNLVAQRGFASSAPQAVLEALRALGNEALARHQPLLIAELAATSPDPQGAAALREVGATAVLLVPLEHGNSALGALAMLGDAQHAFDAAALTFAEAAAHTLALAIHRDRGAESERIRAEELEEANRMASLGLLTASVAHELRGPVGALVLQLEEQQRLLEDAGADAARQSGDSSLVSELSELTADIGTALGRIRGTIDQLSRLSRRDSAPEQLDLSDVVAESLAVARPYLKRRGIDLQEELSTVLVNGRRDNLGQVLLNLVFNAADACEVVAGERKIMVSVAPYRDQVVLQVDDTGPGIPPNTIQTIFAPFYTTKQRGKGTGLGLKICSDVVTAHGGHIEVVNRAEGGASFRVMLPSIAPRAPSDRPGKRAAPGGPSRQLMVIDDDPVFTRTVRRGLKEYEVQTAPTASDAEMTLASSGYRPDLVLCDVFLPGLNGNMLHERVKKHDPDLAERFVFVTGGALSKDEADYLRASGCPTLFKPLNLDDIRDILEDRGGPESARNLRTLEGTQK
jgi:signal transduction histidine kinase/CheY-like chemotaxis protein